MAEVIWTEPALADVRRIFEFIAADSPRYAAITADSYSPYCIRGKASHRATRPSPARALRESLQRFSSQCAAGSVVLNCVLGDVKLIVEKRKLFDLLAKGFEIKNSREFRSSVEHFLASVAEWEGDVVQLVMAA